MIAVRITGGLGNQMFQYAFYRKLTTIYDDVYIDDNDIRRNGNEHNGLELESVFGLHYRRIKELPAKLLTDRPHTHRIVYSVADSILHNLFNLKKMRVYDERDYDPTILENENVYYSGYWSDQRYWSDISDLLRKEFTFKVDLSSDIRNARMLEAIENDCSVSIHIRKGDYLKGNNAGIFGGICTQEYYRSAIEYFAEKLTSPVFYVFSDDNTSDMTELFRDVNYILADWNRGKNSYMDMFLMSRCKHNIIANSTFSWWGSWLNNNPERIIPAPHRFNNLRGNIQSSNWPDGYIQLDYTCGDGCLSFQGRCQE